MHFPIVPSPSIIGTSLQRDSTVEPRYNEVLGAMKITLLYQASHYIRVQKQRNIKSWDQQNYLVIRGFCISDLFIMRFHCINKISSTSIPLCWV